MKTKRTIVFIHGMFGWGYNTEDSARKDEEEGEISYFPVGDIRRVCGESSCVYLDVGIASSDHDRACEAYAQILAKRWIMAKSMLNDVDIFVLVENTRNPW